MSTIAKRLLVGFPAGVLSHLIFQGGLSVVLYAANLVPKVLWSLMPVGPLAVPQSVSLSFWSGLWGLAYAALEPRLTTWFGRWWGGVLFGLAGPLLGHWLVVLPLRGLGVGGGFEPTAAAISIAFHGVFGLGLAIIVRAGLALADRRPASRQVLHG